MKVPRCCCWKLAAPSRACAGTTAECGSAERARRQDGREKAIRTIAHDEAPVGLDQPHERAMTFGGAADQAAGARIAEIVPRQVVAPVLVDAEQAGVARVALAGEV